jgi:hypothetical protein
MFARYRGLPNLILKPQVTGPPSTSYDEACLLNPSSSISTSPRPSQQRNSPIRNTHRSNATVTVQATPSQSIPSPVLVLSPLHPLHQNSRILSFQAHSQILTERHMLQLKPFLPLPAMFLHRHYIALPFSPSLHRHIFHVHLCNFPCTHIPLESQRPLLIAL